MIFYLKAAGKFFAASLLLVGLLSCSVPNLDPVECLEARTALKRFYSIHFDDGFRLTDHELDRQRPFFSKQLLKRVAGKRGEDHDYFTATSDYPKAFRIGRCTRRKEGHTRFQILLFWKKGAVSRQRTITVELVDEDGDWKLLSVSGADSTG